MPARLLAQAVMLALWAAFTIVLGSVFRSVFGGFVDDWVSGLLLRYTRVEQRQVIEALAPFVFPGLVAALAMWAAYAYGAWQKPASRKPKPTKTAPPASRAGIPFNVVEDGGQVAFDYSTHNGRIHVGRGDHMFVLRFAKASDTLIHFNKQGTNLDWIARVRGVKAGDAIDMERVERSSDNYTLGLAELFLARNLAGQLLQGRIASIADDLRGADRDEVVFSYRIMGDLPSTPETALIAALV